MEANELNRAPPHLSEADLEIRAWTPADKEMLGILFASGMQHHLDRSTHPSLIPIFSRVIELAPHFIEVVMKDQAKELKTCIFLAFHDNVLAGMAAVVDKEEDKEQRRGEIKRVAVSDKFFRRGVGSVLMKYVGRYARNEMGAETIYLSTHQAMVSSVLFYRALGFKETVSDRNVPGVADEAGMIVMFEKELDGWV